MIQICILATIVTVVELQPVGHFPFVWHAVAVAVSQHSQHGIAADQSQVCLISNRDPVWAGITHLNIRDCQERELLSQHAYLEVANAGLHPEVGHWYRAPNYSTENDCLTYDDALTERLLDDNWHNNHFQSCDSTLN